jgi:xylan 1,4-beta-xylosidase
MFTKYRPTACFPAWLFWIVIACGVALPIGPARGDLTLDAGCLKQPPPGVRIGQAVNAVQIGDSASLQFQSEGIIVPLASSLAAKSGTVDIRFQLPSDWPSEARGTLFHVGDQSHVHVTLFATGGRLTAVYKAGVDDYAAINCKETARWEAESWHAATFNWQADGQSVDFYLELDGSLVGRQSGRLIDQWPEFGCVGARRRGQAWQGAIDRIRLSTTFAMPRELRPGRRAIVVDGDHGQGDCYNFWSISNYTSQHMFATPGYGDLAKRDKPFMKYVNCVRLLGGRHDGRNAWFKGVDEDGNLNCDFSGMLQYLRGIRDAGYTPRIVLDNIPTAISDPGELAKYGNTRPAKDLKVWHEFVRRALQAMVDEFGVQAVSEWRFRAGTEPDLDPGHWQGTKEEYLRHYDCTVDAVCSVLPGAEIGPGNILNPAHADRVNGAGQKPWGLDIVDHCAVGTNTWTGAVGTRICFLECSWYGAVGRSIDSLDVAIQRMRDRLQRYPRLADLPVSIAEFAILQDEHGRRLYSGDITQWGASWYAAVADRVYDLDVRQVHEWAQATAGILHPRTHVIGMLERMQGGQRLKVAVAADGAARAGALSCVKDGSYYILLYNHRPWRTPSIPEQIDLTLKANRLRAGGEWTVSEWGIDKDQGVFAHQLYADCEQAGIRPLPDSPIYGGNLALRFGSAVHKVLAQNRPNYIQLAQPAVLRQDQPLVVSDGAAKLTIHMPGHSVRLLVICPK